MNNHPDDVEAIGFAASRTFFRIAMAWRLEEADQCRLLGDPLPDAYRSWRRGDSAPNDSILTRIACVIGIYQALHVLFPDPLQADQWIWRPNDAEVFGGRTALDLMSSGGLSGLRTVEQYLQAQLCG